MLSWVCREKGGWFWCLLGVVGQTQPNTSYWEGAHLMIDWLNSDTHTQIHTKTIFLFFGEAAIVELHKQWWWLDNWAGHGIQTKEERWSLMPIFVVAKRRYCNFHVRHVMPLGPKRLALLEPCDGTAPALWAQWKRKIWVLFHSEVEPFWLHAPLSNFHRNERGPASNAVSSSLYTSMIQTMASGGGHNGLASAKMM